MKPKDKKVIFMLYNLQDSTHDNSTLLLQDWFSYLTEKIISFNKFIIKRIPNIKELLTTTSINSAVELWLGEFLKQYGNNPTTKNIIRDGTKIPPILWNVASRNIVGGTEYEYDEGYIYGSLTKFTCKAIMQGSFISIT